MRLEANRVRDGGNELRPSEVEADMQTTTELGKFVRWGEAVTIDMARKIMKVLPIAQPEELIDLPDDNRPSDEALKARVSSY
jgi:hypothetical protein